MTYLVDANVLSEATKVAPVSKVVEWLRSNEREIVATRSSSARCDSASSCSPRGRGEPNWNGGSPRASGVCSVLPWEAETGLRWAVLVAGLRGSGRAMPIKDSLVAATALVHDLVVVTRNRTDFQKAGVIIIDPFAV